MGMLDNKDFEEKAWGSMLELLDKEMPEKKAFPWFRSLILLLLLILIGGGIGYYQMESNVVKEYGAETPSAIASTSNNQEIKIDKNLSIDTKNPTTSLIEEESSSSVKTARSVSEQSNDKQRKIVQSSSFSSSNEQFSINESIVKTPFADSNQQDLSKLNANNSQNNVENEDLQILAKSTEASFSENDVFSTSTLKSNSLISFVNPLDLATIQNVAEENKLFFNPLAASRITALYAVSEIGYNTDFRSLGTSLGLMGEIGASNSPLSFATGLFYERYSLQATTIINNTADLQDEIIETGSSPDSEKFNASDASTLRSISYLSVPLQFHYRFNYIKLGLGIENKFLVHQQVRDGFVRAETSNQFTGALDNNNFGPNKYHLTANQSIAVRIRPRIDLGLHFQYDLTGIFAESAFTLSNVNTSNRLDNVGISLSYKLK